MFHATATPVNVPPGQVPVVRVVTVAETRWEAAEAMHKDLMAHARSHFGHPSRSESMGVLYSSAAQCFDCGADAVEFLDTRYEVKKMDQ